MIMKKLQNNFTTPEQSKKLLELGVPVDSADGFYSRESYRGGKWERPKLFESEEDKVDFKSVYEGGVLMYFPLFTVGRLIEIWHKTNRQQCSVPLSLVITHYNGVSTIMEYLIKLK